MMKEKEETDIPKEKKATLFVVGTPIGNLEDVTFRALRVLQESDAIFCEDTRVTRKLLERYEIKTLVFSYHQHSSEKVYERILEFLREGKHIALVTDAGTPGISDPGNMLVERVLEEGFSVVSIPGVSSLTTLISVAGIDMQKFTFFGFVPHKKGRHTFFERVISSDIPVVYYDSVHRIVKNLQLLCEKNPNAYVIVGR
ncbi:MAG: 16S rRNA (cytidine(1402)-2'-O)-methyltransferase, partial [Candidatus Moranbacteria bacterium]|nr:16S rRNA (cytidine(1402)-2'-O)-methyltransferase [Candidatus Moranbacteria bacterium]